MDIKKARLKKNLSQEQLARKLKVHPATICHYERGIRQPSYIMLKKLANTLDLSINEAVNSFIKGRK